MKVELDLIMGNKSMNNFMHVCDVFEAGKHLGESYTLTLDFTELGNFSDKLKVIKDTLEKNGYDVIFIAVNNINGQRVTEWPILFKESVQTLSNGSKYVLFKDLLSKLGYNSVTDQYMRVLSIQYN